MTTPTEAERVARGLSAAQARGLGGGANSCIIRQAEELAEVKATIDRQAAEIERLYSLAKANNDLAKAQTQQIRQLHHEKAELEGMLEAVRASSSRGIWRAADRGSGTVGVGEGRGYMGKSRAYRIGQAYEHDGGGCPLADGSVRVLIETKTVLRKTTAGEVHWPAVTRFTPLDEGKGQ